MTKDLEELANAARRCGVDPHKRVSAEEAACMADPTANTSTLDRLAGAAKRAFSAVNAEIKEGFVAVATPVVDAIRNVGEPIVTMGARRAEGPANYDTPKPPGR